MANSEAWWAYGSSFQIKGEGSAGSYATVAEVQDISGPSMTRQLIEVSNQDSSDGYREYIPGWRDGDVVTVQANWIPSDSTQDGSVGVLAHFEDDSVRSYKIVLNDGTAPTNVTFDGFVTRFNMSMALESQAKLEFDVKITGPITLA